ncbi:MAG: hypothetical protein WBK91_00775 [Alphaproteobacteria bacterium]
MAVLSKEAKLRAIEEDLPMDLLPRLTPTYIQQSEIAEIAHEALLGCSQQESEERGDGEKSFGGINRFIAVSLNSKNAFIDPAGSLLHGVRTTSRQLRRARGADPAGHKVRPKTARQKQMTVQQAPNTTG